MNISTPAIPGKPTHSELHPVPTCPIGGTVLEPLLDSEEAAALLKIHPKTLQKLARAGTVDAIRIGKLWRFRASALNRWLEEITR
jgi:excisionase family DNA binding protein